MGYVVSVESIGRYKLDGVLGKGGFGVVYRGFDGQREVAVKVMHQALASDDKMRKWFHREARAMANLQHAGIVSVLDYSGPDVPLPFLVMTRLHGHTLGQVLAKLGPLPPAAVVDVAVQIGEALAYAHSRGIIHRDLKPHNFFLEPEGRVVLTDFGLARALANSNLGASLASSGKEIVGTALYLAPEVMNDASSVSAASDVYALGVSLYQLASGQSPFPTQNPMAMITAILGGKSTPLHTLRADYPRALCDLIHKTFAQNAQVRPSDVVAAYSRGESKGEALAALLSAQDELTQFTRVT